MLVDDCRMKAKTFSGLRQIAFGDYGILDLGLIQGRAQSGGLLCGPGSRRDGGRVIAAFPSVGATRDSRLSLGFRVRV